MEHLPPPNSDDNLPPPSPKSPTIWQKASGWLLAILLLGGGIAIGQIWSSSQQPSAQTTAKERPPRPVETITLTSGSGFRQIRLLGEVEATEITTVRSQVDGVVRQFLVKEGDLVTLGMTIAILDDADLRFTLAQARARLAQERSNLARLQSGTRAEVIAQRQAELNAAKAREQEARDNLQRIQELVQEGALPRRSLVEAKTAADTAYSDQLRVEAVLAEALAGPPPEEIEAQQGVVAAAQAVVNQAELELQRAVVKAPLAGVVLTEEVSTGEYVETRDPLITLISGKALDIILEVPEQLSGQVRRGMSVKLTARALPNWSDRATISAIVPAANPTSRQQLVRISLANPPSDLLSGMAVQAELELPVRGGGSSFVVPRDTLTRRGEQWLVFVVADGRAKQLVVDIVTDMGEKVVIGNPNLQAGQSIVISGGDGLRDGAAVRVVGGIGNGEQ